MSASVSSRKTFQYKESISVNRDRFLEKVVRNRDLNKKDLRVCLHLLTHLDSVNYKEISKKQLAYDLDMTKSEVGKAINNLIEYDVIDIGSSASVDKGLKLLF